MSNVHPALSSLLYSEIKHEQHVTRTIAESTAPTGLAGKLYCERRRREIWFDEGMFWEPSWDLLLYLYDAFESGQVSLSVKSVSAAPFAISEESTARWLELLVVHGYIVIGAEAETVSLTAKATEALRGFLGVTEE